MRGIQEESHYGGGYAGLLHWKRRRQQEMTMTNEDNISREQQLTKMEKPGDNKQKRRQLMITIAILRWQTNTTTDMFKYEY